MGATKSSGNSHKVLQQTYDIACSPYFHPLFFLMLYMHHPFPFILSIYILHMSSIPFSYAVHHVHTLLFTHVVHIFSMLLPHVYSIYIVVYCTLVCSLFDPSFKDSGLNPKGMTVPKPDPETSQTQSRLLMVMLII